MLYGVAASVGRDKDQPRITRNKVFLAQMTTRMTWPELCCSEQFKGLWVALDNCRYDSATRQPTEGDVVDADDELSMLCARMREAGRSSCAIFFCDDEVLVESGRPSKAPVSERRGAFS